MKSISFIIDALHDEKNLVETLKRISQAHTKKSIYKKHIMVCKFIKKLLNNYLIL